MNNLISTLEKKGVKSACNKIGLDFQKLFANDLNYNSYKEHIWYVNNHSKVIVFSAVPPENKQDRLFWEEWYRMREEKEYHHHVLTRWRPKYYDEIYNAPEHDDIHPEPIFRKKWYVVDDPDMSPWLLRY